jgi:hypothetical protein
MPILNHEDFVCQNARYGCRLSSSAECPGTGRVSDIEYEFVSPQESNLYIRGREGEGPVRLKQYHRCCHTCPHGVLKVI